MRSSPGEADVATVAHQLGLDHSGASRMVKDAAARQWQRHVFDDLTSSWDEPDRRRFGAYLGRLADDVGA